MTGNRNILVVEDDPKDRVAIGRSLEQWGYVPTTTSSGPDAIEKVKSDAYSFIIANYDATGLNPMAFFKEVVAENDAARVLFLSGTASIDAAVDIMKAGAFDFLSKPIDEEHLQHMVKRAFIEEEGPPTCKPRQKGNTQIVTQDSAMRKLLDLARQVADSRASVLIQGDSGTGKELIARYIHEHSTRRQGPFIAINCGALPETLLESELFGHEKGAFTGAISKKPGKFELADGGTILLDEITEMPLHLQAKLLRVLQEREIDRLGGCRPVQVDIRVIATTNRNMKQTIEEKEFREDLFYRLNVIPIKLPSLKKRQGDIPILAQYFIEKYNELDGRRVKKLSESAVQKLLALPFNGNVRELENIIERAVLLCDGTIIRDEDLFLSENVSGNNFEETKIDEITNSFEPRPLREVEKTMIFQTLGQTNGNRTHAAKMLGISVRTLRNKLNEYKETMEMAESGM
jgi:DNA-binding NtrC family response regulator